MMMPEDPQRRNKRVHPREFGEDDFYPIGHEETEEEIQYLLHKMRKLFEEKMNKFPCPDHALQEKGPMSTFEFGSTSSVAAIAAFSCSEAVGNKVTKSKKSTRPMKKKKKVPIVSNEVTQRLERFITDELNGKEAKVVIQKTLFASDLLKSQNRLNMPMNQLETDDFLTENEKREVRGGKGLEVKLWGPTLQMHDKPMVLTIWNLKNTDNYVLKSNWNSFVKENEEDFKEKTWIQVWSFRREDEQLCFAIACLEGVDGQNDIAAAVNI